MGTTLPKARTISEVIAGEAVSGTREQRYADMLGIASVISNRSTVTGVPAESIVSAPNQFDAYGKSLPPGTSAYTGMAQQAWDQVQTSGPVHPGTYYATPSAAKNLPSGLAEVTATTGHKYFVDPAARAIKTAVGTIKPSVEAVAGLVNNTIGAVGDTLGGLLPDSAPTPQARPSVGVPGGMAALAPNGLNYNLSGARRNQVPTSGIGLKVADVASSVMPGVTTNLFSGMEPVGARPVGAPNRHPLGFAGDFTFTDAIGQPVTDPVAMQDIAMGMAAKHNANIGFGGVGYMNPGSLHIDTMPVGPGAFPGGQQWGDLPGGFAETLGFARETGIGPTPYSGAPTPFGPGEVNPNNLQTGNVNATPKAEAYSQAAQSMGEAGVRGLGAAQQFSAPVGKVDRAPLGPASLPPDRPMPSGPLAVGSLPPDRQIPAGPISLPPDRPMPMGMIAQGVPQAPVAQVQAPMPAPVLAPMPAPAAPPAPVQAPPVNVPHPALNSFPSRPAAPAAPPSFSAGDIYGGQVGSALASGGNTVARDAFGRTSVTNKHGVTTVSMPDGKQAAGGLFTGAPGSLFGGAPMGGKVAGFAKAAAGGMAGAQLGGLLGPVGAVLGGYVGSQLAQGKTPFGGLFGNTGTGRGLGHFPDAPKPSSKNWRDMPDVSFGGFGSGKQASAAEANRGGGGVTSGPGGAGLW